MIGREMQSLLCQVYRVLITALLGIDDRKIVVSPAISRVSVDFIPISLGGSVKLPTNIKVINTCDGHLLAFAGMLPQLKGLSKKFAGPSDLAQTCIVFAQSKVSHGKTRIKFYGLLCIRQFGGGSFLMISIAAATERSQGLQ